jgi:hypothetical protein
MPYPLIHYPTFAEFIARLTSEFKCQLGTLASPITDGDGESHAIHYLERVVDDQTIRCVIHIEDSDECITLSLLRSVLARLKIDPKLFGLSLD